MKFLVLDLELNKTGDADQGGETTDIIQIGAVIYDTDTKSILPQTFNRFVKHYDDRGRLSKFIVKLTGITNSIIENEGVDIITATNDFYTFAKNNNISRVMQWGSGDIETLEAQYQDRCLNPTEDLLSIHKDSYKLFQNYEGTTSVTILMNETPFKGAPLNLKHMYQLFAISEGVSPRGGLALCLKKIGLEFKGRKHNALDDAYNTAVLLDRILNNKKHHVAEFNKIIEEAYESFYSPSRGLTDVVTKDTIKDMLSRL
jgi:inhibitor of KinA sporulation pathway (predicted exonuclease)